MKNDMTETTTKTISPVTTAISAAYAAAGQEIHRLTVFRGALEAAGFVVQAPARAKATIRTDGGDRLRRRGRPALTPHGSRYSPVGPLRQFVAESTSAFTTREATEGIRQRGWKPNPRVKAKATVIAYQSLKHLQNTGEVMRNGEGWVRTSNAGN